MERVEISNEQVQPGVLTEIAFVASDGREALLPRLQSQHSDHYF